MSLTRLAATAEVSKSYLSSLENNTTDARPSGETLYKIASALGVTMSDLLGRPLLVESSSDVPKSLQVFAKEARLPEADVRMLASIKFRGEQPRTKERWRHIYDAIRTSSMMDQRRR